MLAVKIIPKKNKTAISLVETFKFCVPKVKPISVGITERSAILFVKPIEIVSAPKQRLLVKLRRNVRTTSIFLSFFNQNQLKIVRNRF